jgi:hypothetical protein
LAELRESSLLFSLESLMAEERSRVVDERVAKEARQRADHAEREAHERRRVEEEALRAAAERDRLLEADRRKRDELARLDGIRVAEVERVRDEAARKTAFETAAAGRDHELKLAAIHNAGGVRTLRGALAATSLAALAAFASMGWLELSIHPARTARLEADLTRATVAERGRADNAEQALKASEAVRRLLEERLKVREATPRATADTTTPKPPPIRVPTRGTRAPSSKGGSCKGDPNDPLNGCLPG